MYKNDYGDVILQSSYVSYLFNYLVGDYLCDISYFIYYYFLSVIIIKVFRRVLFMNKIN